MGARRQTSIKSDRVADLLDALTARTGESKVEAVTVALEHRLQQLERIDRGKRTTEWLEYSVWPALPEGRRGKAPSKEEQEELLGY